MDFKNIPILGDIDFSDPKKRKSSIRIVAAMAMVLVVIILIIVKNISNRQDTEPQETSSYESIEIPMGEDNDRLQGKTIRDVSQGRRGRAGAFAEDLFSSQSASDDPLATLSGQGTGENASGATSDETLPSFMRAGGNQNVYPESSPSDAKSAKKPEAKKEPRTPASSQQSLEEELTSGKYQGYDAKRRRLYEEYGLDPDTGQPVVKKETSTGSSGSSSSSVPSFMNGTSQTTVAQETATKEEKGADEPEQAIEPVKVQVRRSGGVSSFGSSGTDLSNLGEMDEYVTDDPAHPFKVKFAYDEKVSSGKRVTIRLCEDMVVDGVLIPVNTHLFATCQVGERLKLSVTSIDIGGKIYTLNYTAYDNDGVEGLYCPTSKTGEIAKELGNQAVQLGESAISSAITGYPSRIFQGGVQAVRSKSGTPSVSVTAGYTFYLIQNKR